MREDGARRFCDECNKHVYDLTCMREDEVRALVSKRGKICGRIAVTTAIAMTGCSAADQQSGQPTVQIGPLTAPPPKPDAGPDPSEYTLGEIDITH